MDPTRNPILDAIKILRLGNLFPALTCNTWGGIAEQRTPFPKSQAVVSGAETLTSGDRLRGKRTSGGHKSNKTSTLCTIYRAGCDLIENLQ
jgi:hypothetical protein